MLTTLNLLATATLWFRKSTSLPKITAYKMASKDEKVVATVEDTFQVIITERARVNRLQAHESFNLENKGLGNKLI